MPGLLDLPPEIIEHIYLIHTQLALAEYENSARVAKDLCNSRLTNGYIERATRRAFVKQHFATWLVNAPDDVNIQKFCTMASTPDLAAAIEELVLLVDKDYTTKLPKAGSSRYLDTKNVATLPQSPNSQFSDKNDIPTQGALSSASSEEDITHAFDKTTGALVPIAYLWHRNSLIAAFRACRNVTKLWIVNTSLVPDGANRCKHLTQPNSFVAPAEDDGDQQEADLLNIDVADDQPIVPLRRYEKRRCRPIRTPKSGP